MNNIERMQYIKKQEDKLTELDQDFVDVTERYKELMSHIPFSDILNRHGQKIDINSKSSFEDIAKLYFENRATFDAITKDLNEYSEYAESMETLANREIIKKKYFVQLYYYIIVVVKTREETFSKEYMRRIDMLADKGYMLYFDYLPDNNIELLEEEKLEEYIICKYSNNNFEMLFKIMDEFLAIKHYDNSLQQNKLEDLTECMLNLKDCRYRSCARGLFSLLENEHVKTVQVVTKNSVYERSKKIQEYINKLNIPYYTNAWNKMAAFYKLCNINTKYQKDNDVNRHDLAHGIYKESPTKEDCIKLILLYLCIKDIRYILNNINLLIEENEMDTLIANANNVDKS